MALGAEGTTVPLVEAGLDVLPPAATDEPVDAVLVGWTRHFGLPELEALVEAVWKGAMPYTMSDAPYFAGANGRILGVSGAVGAMIAQTTDVVPVVLGKPSVLGMEMISTLTGGLRSRWSSLATILPSKSAWRAGRAPMRSASRQVFTTSPLLCGWRVRSARISFWTRWKI